MREEFSLRHRRAVYSSIRRCAVDPRCALVLEGVGFLAFTAVSFAVAVRSLHRA